MVFQRGINLHLQPLLISFDPRRAHILLAFVICQYKIQSTLNIKSHLWHLSHAKKKTVPHYPFFVGIQFLLNKKQHTD